MASQTVTTNNGRFKCTFEDCDKHFPTEREMKKHKYKDAFHDYCHKCDKDFDSLPALLEHKAFTPEVHNLACRVCGEEFKTVKGLCRHVELNHKIDQRLKCVGCEGEFSRASLLIEHIEFDHCTVIRPNHLYASIIHKNLVSTYLNKADDLDAFIEKQSTYQAAIDTDAHDGGINLMDDYNESQDISGYEAFQQKHCQPALKPVESDGYADTSTPPPHKNERPLDSTTCHSKHGAFDEIQKRLANTAPTIRASETWMSEYSAVEEIKKKLKVMGKLDDLPKLERLSVQEGDGTTAAAKAAQIGSTTTAAKPAQIDPSPAKAKAPVWGGSSANVLFSKATPAAVPNDAKTSPPKLTHQSKNSFPGDTSPSKGRPVPTLSKPTMKQIDKEAHTEDVVVWGGNAAKKLFEDVNPPEFPSKPLVPTQANREEALTKVVNLMSSRVWDPTCDDWAPEQFFNSIKNIYHCPFPCSGEFLLPIDLAKHIIEDHRIRSMQCPKCYRNFKSCTGLVAHCESTESKCTINRMEEFGIYLDNMTGGFLSVQEKTRPDHEHNPTIMVRPRPSKPAAPWRYPKVDYLKFEPSNPPDYKEPKKVVGVEIGGGREK